MFAALTFSLLIGSALPALAQTARPSADALRDDRMAPPPISVSSPYGSSRQGTYVLPGTIKPKQDKEAAPPRRLPSLPPKESFTPPARGKETLPSPRLLSAPANPENHRAETPASLRYIRPSERPRQPAYPKPQPLLPQSSAAAEPVLTSPVQGEAPQPLPQVPVQQAAPTAPQAIPFGQPSAPVQAEPQITIERAIPVTPQWQEPPAVTPSKPATQQPPAKLPAADSPPMGLPVQTPPQEQPSLAQEFESIISAPAAESLLTPQTETAPERLPGQDMPPLPALVEEMPAIPPLPGDETLQAVPTELIQPMPLPSLSEESRKIISSTPSGIDTKKTVIRSPKPVVIKRTDPNAGLGPDIRSHEEMGLKIEVRRADVNIQQYLEGGYENLLAGRESIAAGYYEEALNAEPKNETALFGLATTYQRMGRRDEARELYGKLFALNPTHREGLNNFMALISDEAPQEAIEELEKLETENPDFSPIPAQLGIVYNRIGNPKMAARKLARALHLSPDNLSYKYSLAITLDKLGQTEQASDLYLELIEAYNKGATLPGNVEDIRNRVIFINRKQ